MSDRWRTYWKDYYQILQVHPTAEQEVIKAAYDRLARKYHPDVNQESSSTQRMVDINEAFEVLGTLETRRLYHPEWLQKRRESNNRQAPPRASTPPEFALQRFPNAQPVWHFVLLSLFTLNLYQFYWFYRNWKQLRFHEGWDISPGWRTVGLFVPILNLFLSYSQFKHIRIFAMQAGCETLFSVGWIWVGFVIFNGLSASNGPFWLLGFLSIWPLAVVQDILNSYWKKKQPELTVRTKFSGGQIALMVVGGIILILTLFGLLIPEPFLDTPLPRISY